MKKRKVLMIGNHQSVKGGITSVITQLMNHEWNNKGVEMKFIPSYIEAGTLNKTIYFVIAYLKILLSMLIFNPDILHIHMSYKGSFHRKFLIHKLCKFFGKKDIIHLHGSEFKKFYDETNDKTRRNIRCLLRECDAMVVLGEKWDKTIKSVEPSTNTIVVCNTVKRSSQTVMWNENSFTSLFLGVLIKRKGVADLFNAISLLKKDGTLDKNNYKFLIAGTGSEEENLKKQTSDLQIESYVEFVGWIDGKKKEELIKKSQLLILPSYNEGLPIAILESISYGMPIISTKVGSIDEAVLEGINGYLVNPGDVQSIVDRFKEISTSKDTWHRFKKNSINIVEEKFDENVYFNNFIKLYETV